MVCMNISGFITNNIISSRELRQSIGARVTKTAVLEQCGGSSSSKDVVCGRMRSMHGRKMDGVQRPKAITHVDHISSSKILH
jgi:hypothetical protein